MINGAGLFHRFDNGWDMTPDAVWLGPLRTGDAPIYTGDSLIKGRVAGKADDNCNMAAGVCLIIVNNPYRQTARIRCFNTYTTSEAGEASLSTRENAP